MLTLVQDTLCAQCFSSAISAVSVTRSTSRCPACLQEVQTFVPEATAGKSGKHRPQDTGVSSWVDNVKNHVPSGETSHVLRIDNIAWVGWLSSYP